MFFTALAIIGLGAVVAVAPAAAPVAVAGVRAVATGSRDYELRLLPFNKNCHLHLYTACRAQHKGPTVDLI